MGKHVAFWFRRDLRLNDNAGLYHALRAGQPVVPVFIFDRHILDNLSAKVDARVHFIRDVIGELSQELKEFGSSIVVRYGFPEEIWSELAKEFDLSAVYTNRDYEPYANQRDEQVRQLLGQHNCAFHTFKDHVIFEQLEVEKNDGGPYTVFTPYSRKWKEKLASRMAAATIDGERQQLSFYLKPYPTESYFDQLASLPQQPIPDLEDMGFATSSIEIPQRSVQRKLIKNYDQTRNFPAQEGTSRLGIHFRFGTISIREKAWRAQQLNDTFLNELIWRDFYAQILANFPYVAERSFRPEYDYIDWRNDETEFKTWCEGRTGYPIVDAGMRQLNQSGYMHNRVCPRLRRRTYPIIHHRKME